MHIFILQQFPNEFLKKLTLLLHDFFVMFDLIMAVNFGGHSLITCMDAATLSLMA